jgi:recombinational DNA repair ATPase RecF
MSLLDDILVWSTTGLTLWQRDALRRLFQKENLEPQDYDDLYAMMKSAKGLSDPKRRQPVPLSQEHLSVQGDNSTPVILRALRDLKNVNRIAPGQKLEFAHKGMTVVYGGNASGKSGYSRVLKRACRARDISEPILPDAFNPNSAKNLPEATFDIKVGEKLTSLNWNRDATPPNKLSTIAVFDSRCARVYLDNENDVAYLPYGLDIIENLGQDALPKLTDKLNAEIDAINIDTAPFADLQGETAVGKMIASLSADTDPEKVTSLATMTTDELSRLTLLGKTLTESDPKAKAKALRISAQRIKELVDSIDTAIALVNDAAVERIKACDIEAETASKAEAIAAKEFQAGETLLPGTGEHVWKNLFEAARRFATNSAYPGKPFPFVAPDAKCLLCQQPLDQDAAERMQRFENFVKQDTAKVAVKKCEERQEATQEIEKAILCFGLKTALTEELNQMDTSILQVTQDFERRVEARRKWLLKALETHIWDATPSLGADPRPGLTDLSEKSITQADDLDKIDDREKKKALKAEYEELKAREILSKRISAVLGLVQRLEKKAKLTKCKDDLKTRAISNKAKELASKAVTNALKTALDNEFMALGVGYIKTILNERVEHGRMKHKLVLDLPSKNNLKEILSEGEQRAIAIGAFLAEIRQAHHQGGIVFDDPVSSLDHHWRRNVALRLVEEAKNRQVIVFTHDTVFLSELGDQFEQQQCEHLIQHLDRMDKSAGYVNKGLPWEHKSYRDRLDKLEKAQRVLDKTWPPYPNEKDRAKMRREYNFLRATIERVIQDVVFNGVVQRYRDWIKVPRLKDVVGFTEAEYKKVARLNKACCDVIDAHDPSSAKDTSVPSAKQLGRDIAALKAVVETIKIRRKSQNKTAALEDLGREGR